MVNIFLKKIRLKGFKSFANKTEIEIEEKITAVVGPNGSGKSNIVDAIRWVLGEQSAKNLRGSKMADIIFAGTEKLNAKNKAAVTLFFDNTGGELPVEGKELTIGRQVNSEGRSDYLINGAVCRLKDIEMLLMDSGLGSDGYSIVGQGKIDSIIKSKPDKLRLFFEEAAGIMKHKSRQEAAEKRLANTNNDLKRIYDLVDELEKRHDPLKKAAAKAEKYQSYQSELAELEISLLNKQWQEESAEFKKLSQKRSALEKKLNQKESSYNAVSYKLENSKDQLKADQAEKEDAAQKYFQNQNKLNEINNNLNVMAERKSNYSANKEKLAAALVDLKREKEENKQALKKAERNFELINSDQQDLKTEIENIRDQLELNESKITELKEKIKKRNSQIEADQKEIQKKNSALERLKERIEISGQRWEEISAEKNKFKLKLEAAQADKKKLQHDLDQQREDKEKKENELEKFKRELSQQNKNLAAGKEKLIALKEDYQHYNSRLELMEEMQAGYEGYYNGVRSVLEKKEQFPGVIDVVAEIISVEAEYEKAVETALAAKMQNIIVEDDQTAKKAVKYLKSNNKGRATFLPLNMVSGSRFNERLLDKLSSQEGFIGLAVDLLSFPERLENVFNFLLGRIVVTKNIDSAVEISKNIKSSFKLVSLEGDVVYPGGAISGGSSSSSSRDLIGRSRKIKELKAKRNQLQQQGKKLVAELEAEKEELEEKKKIIEAEAEKLQQLKMDLNNTLNNKNQLEGKIAELKAEKDSSQNNLSSLDSSLTDNKKSISAYQKEITELKAESSSLEAEIAELKAEIGELTEKNSELRPQLKELELDGARISEKRNTAAEKVELEKTKLKKVKAELKENKDQISTIESKITKIGDRNLKLKQKKKELKKEAEKLKAKKSELTAQIDRLESKTEAEEKEAKKLQQELNKLKDNFHQLDLKYSSLEDKLESIKSILSDNYDLKPAEIKQAELIEIKDQAVEKVERKIKELKGKIKKLHPVNEAAVEEFAELKERLDYLHEQQNDLKQARNSIELVISDIEESMEKMFAETFYQVKKEFSQVFKALFQGGKAELKLSNPEEMLTTGVEIQAQPPGKSLKSLSLLSGGERALTAIALIFAFIQVKPSPFYVLDEIDAPLDDVNIVRFASFIKKYAKVAQFIIITHRRYMMTEVDSLYGVTMKKSGVSSLISLKLDQAEEFNENYIKEAL